MARRPSLPEPTDVVSGRARVTIEQLFALIHDVNPTDKGLSARQQAEGYAVKSRLQSFLIRQHADLLVVERHPSNERVVSIQHRVAGRDACHAVVPSLDDDARRWVETELGLAERRAKTAGKTEAPAPAERKATAAGPGDPMSAGRAALESYDYDEARRIFSQLLDRSPGNLAAAEALLDLLVNHLADDEAAVALGQRLVAPASTNSAVLGCLALAAARHGDVSLARRWLKGADPTGAVEAWVLLGEHAARIGSLDDTRACVIAIHEMEPGHRALPRLRDAVARMQADERAPAETGLSTAILTEDWLEAERLARDILARWPMSEPARAAQRELARLHKERDSRELVGRAWQAWHRGDTASLLSAIAQARALGVADVDTVAWMDEAEGAAQEQIESTRFARARDALAEGALVVGLTEWLALKPGPQAELREAFRRPEFGWLDAVPVGEGRVHAVVALGEAQDAFLEDDIEGAARLLEPHVRLLRAVPDARGLLNDIARTRGELDERASVAAQRRIADARAAGDFDGALALSAGLAPETRRRVRAEIEAERANTARLRLTEDAIAAGDILRARELARKRGDVAVVAELTARLRSEWKISVWADIDPGVVDVTLPPDPVCPLPWLVDDGAAFVYVQVLAGWVFARVIELATLAVRRVVSFRAPEAMRVHYVQVEDDVVTVVDQWGALVAFHLNLREVPLDDEGRLPGLRIDQATAVESEWSSDCNGKADLCCPRVDLHITQSNVGSAAVVIAYLTGFNAAVNGIKPTAMSGATRSWQLALLSPTLDTERQLNQYGAGMITATLVTTTLDATESLEPLLHEAQDIALLLGFGLGRRVAVARLDRVAEEGWMLDSVLLATPPAVHSDSGPLPFADQRLPPSLASFVGSALPALSARETEFRIRELLEASILSRGAHQDEVQVLLLANLMEVVRFTFGHGVLVASGRARASGDDILAGAAGARRLTFSELLQAVCEEVGLAGWAPRYTQLRNGIVHKGIIEGATPAERTANLGALRHFTDRLILALLEADGAGLSYRRADTGAFCTFDRRTG